MLESDSITLCEEEKAMLRQYLLLQFFNTSDAASLTHDMVVKTFAEFDKDDNGSISRGEFREAAVEMGVDPRYLGQ